MASKFRVFTRKFFVFCNLAIALVFLLSCMAPGLDPRSWWIIAILGIGFPILLLLVILFLFGWLVIKPRYALISAIALLFSIKSISIFFAFHNTGGFRYKKEP